MGILDILFPEPENLKSVTDKSNKNDKYFKPNYDEDIYEPEDDDNYFEDDDANDWDK